MKRQIRPMVLATLVLGMLMVSCGPNTVPTTTPIPTPPPTGEAYPLPALASSAYPSPSQDLSVYNPYPGPVEGPVKLVSWDEAVELIQSGKVAKVYQAQTLNVTLVLKDGTFAGTVEPSRDDVVKVIEACGEACKDIEKINE